jgi:hypothetical protein
MKPRKQRDAFRRLLELEDKDISGNDDQIAAWRWGKSCAISLWKLIKENCYVKYLPFQDLMRTTGELLNQGNGQALAGCFRDYWRKDENFIPLSGNILEVTGKTDKEHFTCTVTPDKESFLPMSFYTPCFMVDFDFTTRTEERKHWMIEKYEQLFNRLTRPCQIALVYKKYGPYGPLLHRDMIDGELRKRAPKIENVFVFSQALEYPVANTEVKPDLPVVILYDLLATGEGLNEIAKALYNKCELNRNQPVSAMVVYAYNKELIRKEEKDNRHRRFLEFSFDEFEAEPEKLPRIASPSGELASTVYLLNGKGDMPKSPRKTDEKISEDDLKNLRLTKDSLFKRCQREDIDSALGNGYQFTTADVAFCWRKDIIKGYAGQFCAMWKGKPIGEFGKTKEELETKLVGKHSQYHIYMIPGRSALDNPTVK